MTLLIAVEWPPLANIPLLVLLLIAAPLAMAGWRLEWGWRGAFRRVEGEEAKDIGALLWIAILLIAAGVFQVLALLDTMYPGAV